jgi:uncharacterized membrane protein
MLYLIVKWIHVLSAITALGANITYPLLLRAAGSDPQAKRFALRSIARLEIVANIGYGVLLITGFAMLFIGGIPISTPWVASAIAVYVIVGFLAGSRYTPALRKQIQLAEAPGPSSPEYLAAEESTQRLGMIILLLVVVIEFLMTVKPALWG